MRLTRDGRFERSDIWREGKWLDLWSVVHLLSGTSVGFSLIFIKFGTIASIVIGLLLLVVYEMWEAIVKIEETPQNRFMDVVVGMVSFLPTFFFFQGLPTSLFILVFGFILTVNITMATFGWLASRKAEEFEQKLRSEFIEQRRRLSERKARFRDTMKRRRLRRTQGRPQ
ncbi:MAG: hypothetical protein Q7S50_01450 [bacterium]|nr:hypothetical protein [bacterium]